MGNKNKAHPSLILDAADPARVRLATRGASTNVGYEDLKCDQVPFSEAIRQLDLPPGLPKRREGEDHIRHALRCAPQILDELERQFGPLNSAETAEWLRSVATMMALRQPVAERTKWLVHFARAKKRSNQGA